MINVHRPTIANPKIRNRASGQQAAPLFAMRCRRTSPQKLVLQTTRHRVPCQITHAAQQAPTSSEPDAVLCEARSTNAARQTYPRRTSSRSVPHATHFGASPSVGLPFAGATTRTPRFFKRRSARMRSDSSVSPTDRASCYTSAAAGGGWKPTLKEACSHANGSATCVQRFDDSRNSAIRITYRISLRSSSLREPRYPLLRVVQ